MTLARIGLRSETGVLLLSCGIPVPGRRFLVVFVLRASDLKNLQLKRTLRRSAVYAMLYSHRMGKYAYVTWICAAQVPDVCADAAVRDVASGSTGERVGNATSAVEERGLSLPALGEVISLPGSDTSTSVDNHKAEAGSREFGSLKQAVPNFKLRNRRVSSSQTPENFNPMAISASNTRATPGKATKPKPGKLALELTPFFPSTRKRFRSAYLKRNFTNRSISAIKLLEICVLSRSSS